MSTFSYLPFPAKTKIIYKPALNIRLGYKKSHRIIPNYIPALLDTGADVCFCSNSITAWLHVKPNKNEHKFTAANNSKFKAFKENLTLYIAGKQYNCPFFITPELPRQTPIILGHLGFFDRFKVSFDTKNLKIKIESSTFKDMP